VVPRLTLVARHCRGGEGRGSLGVVAAAAALPCPPVAGVGGRRRAEWTLEALLLRNRRARGHPSQGSGPRLPLMVGPRRHHDGPPLTAVILPAAFHTGALDLWHR
jgi:hypothetical protein